MLRSTKELRRYAIRATDGEIGTVDDLLFDDASWRIRYLVANTRRWLPGRKVLVSPVALNEPDWPDQTIPITLSKEQLRNGPGLDQDEPVSRQHERGLMQMFGWPAYWMHELPQVPGTWSPPVTEPLAPQSTATRGDPHLRSAHEIIGYHIHADDGDIGRMDDLIVETADWSLPYMVIDLHPWLPGRRVILAPGWAHEIDWSERRVSVDLTKDLVEGAPPYDPAQPVNRAYEERLYDYFGRPLE